MRKMLRDRILQHPLLCRRLCQRNASPLRPFRYVRTCPGTILFFLTFGATPARRKLTKNWNSFVSSLKSIAQGPLSFSFVPFTLLFALMNIPSECSVHVSVSVCMYVTDVNQYSISGQVVFPGRTTSTVTTMKTMTCVFGPQEQLNEVTIPPNLVSPGDTPSPPTDSSGSSMSTAATDQTMSTRCPIEMVVARKLRNKSFSFAGIDNCGPGCGGIYFSDSQRNIVAPLFILLFAFVCILFTAFTVATFFINRNRFHYPERPIVYLSLCYLILSGAYFIGAISKLVGGGDVSFGCTATYARSTEEVEHLITETQYSAEVIPALPSRFVFQSLPNDNVTLRTASCVILFLLAYYTQMAASLWWVILTFTWFLAAVLKWGEEAVARLWPLYHVVTWSLPAVQTILVLALQLVDGDQLSGLCYPGQFSRVALGVFVYMPLLIYLLLGTVFLVIGFSALVKIRHALERDPVKARKLGRLIIRIGVYAGLYILTNSILLFIHTYELAERESWEKSYVEGETCRSNSNPSQCENSPNFAAFLIRYIALFFVGICSTSWVFSKKTLSTWTKFFQSCGCGHAGKSDVSQAYGLPEKDPRRLQTAV
ncbi:Frizzled-7-B [Geodia barretti]|uniref:Frizzled-7-B n=1 Tax=Geodia barretti TaxID=519541 RepID=A0AA35T2V3_GEOBA|nr:Frizzled-7-B [Geodia barretti]